MNTTEVVFRLSLMIRATPTAKSDSPFQKEMDLFVERKLKSTKTEKST